MSIIVADTSVEHGSKVYIVHPSLFSIRSGLILYRIGTEVHFLDRPSEYFGQVFGSLAAAKRFAAEGTRTSVERLKREITDSLDRIEKLILVQIHNDRIEL